MIARRVIPAFIIAALFAVATSEADAQILYGQGGGYGPYGHPYGSSLYSLGRIPVPPYFSLHPPVYYSGIKPTTYGSTPFAQRPRITINYPVHKLPAPAADQPAMRMKSPETQSARATKVVMNPFVKSEPTLAPRQPADHSPETRSAKVIQNPYVAKPRLASAR